MLFIFSLCGLSSLHLYAFKKGICLSVEYHLSAFINKILIHNNYINKVNAFLIYYFENLYRKYFLPSTHLSVSIQIKCCFRNRIGSFTQINLARNFFAKSFEACLKKLIISSKQIH